jgi:predicted aconitase
MHLTREEESTLGGERGPGQQKAMELLVALGDLFGANQLIPITRAHVSGVSYKTIREGGLSWLKELARQGVVVSVPTTLNPCGRDPQHWEEMGVDAHFNQRQAEILKAYAKMGLEMVCTCTPFLIGRSPNFGEHVASAESANCIFLNSGVGARTNREGAPAALAAAIIGKTANYGLHLDENRRAQVIVEVNLSKEKAHPDYPVVGTIIGEALDTKVPFIRGVRPGDDDLKNFGAAMASWGSLSLFHVEGITPEADEQDLKGLERIEVTDAMVSERRAKLSSAKIEEVDLIAFGCPHLSAEELIDMAMFLESRERIRPNVELWMSTSKVVAQSLRKEVQIIERFGRVIVDTCQVVTPVENKHKVTALNSAKAAFYMPKEGFGSQRIVYGSTEELLSWISRPAAE